jgi:hypothetical protein
MRRIAFLGAMTLMCVLGGSLGAGESQPALAQPTGSDRITLASRKP